MSAPGRQVTANETEADEIERAFLDALRRLEEGKPRARELKAKVKEGRLKINISNVALEAGRSRTLIALDNCRYPRIREAVKLAQGGKKSVPSTYTQLIENLRADLVRAKTENQMLQNTINDHFLARMNAEKKAAAHAQINAKLHKELNELSKVTYLASREEPQPARLVLIRGLPGSGKTTLAKKYKKEGYEHFEADMFFVSEGRYIFDPDKLSEAHAWCLQQTRDALSQGRHVVVANVFASVEDIMPYTTQGFGYEIVEATANGKSKHDVSVAVLWSMKAAWVPTEVLSESLKLSRTSKNKVTSLREASRK